MRKLVCQNMPMSKRTKAVFVFGLTLAMARILGLHFHLPATNGHELEVLVQPAAFETPHHHEDSGALAHSQADDEDVDVDEPAAAVSKPVLPDTSWLLVSIACALLVLAVVRASPVVAPPFRPPRTPSRGSLLPPSHAPPRAA
jgi:hypothetical protein